MSAPKARPFLVAIPLAIAVAASVLAWHELAAIRLSRLSGSTLILQVANDAGPMPTGLGLATRNLILDNCASAQLSIFAAVFPQPVREAQADRCREAAITVLKSTPASGTAFYAAAVSAASLGDWPESENALRLSQQVSPMEGWLAERRVNLALARFADLDDETRAALASDVALLSRESRYRGGLAQRYLANEAARPWIESVVETQSEATQSAFLAALRSAAR